MNAVNNLQFGSIRSHLSSPMLNIPMRSSFISEREKASVEKSRIYEIDGEKYLMTPSVYLEMQAWKIMRKIKENIPDL